jgi:putative oxidoreductase
MDDGRGLIEITAHVLIAALFLVAGVKNLIMYRFNVTRIAAQGLPFAPLVLLFGVAVQMTGGVMVLFGYRLAPAAVMLIAFTIASTAMFHRFWEMEDPLIRNYHMVLLLNNLAISGGLLLLL